MKRDEFVESFRELVQTYINDWDQFDTNPQIRVNPNLLYLELVNGSDMLDDISDSEEAIEDAAYAQGDETESATDFQASQDPEFYPVKTFLKPDGSNNSIPDMEKINKVADKYFK